MFLKNRNWFATLLLAFIAVCSSSTVLADGNGDSDYDVVASCLADPDSFSISSLLGNTLPDGTTIPDAYPPHPLGSDAYPIQWLNDATLQDSSYSIVSVIVNRDEVPHDVNWSISRIWAENLGQCEVVAVVAPDLYLFTEVRQGPLEYGRDTTVIDTEVHSGYVPEFANLGRLGSSGARVLAGDEGSVILIVASWWVTQIDGTDGYRVEWTFGNKGSVATELMVLPSISAPMLARAIAEECDSVSTLDPEDVLKIEFSVEGPPRPVSIGLIVSRADGGDGPVVRTYVRGYGG